MTFSETRIRGVYLIETSPRVDERGTFTRLWCEDQFRKNGLDVRFVQFNHSLTLRRGTVRGLHYQVPPYSECKLVRCIRGELYDVAVDVRPESETYKQWIGVELCADEPKLVFIPEGVAHGFQVLEDRTEIVYSTSAPHDREAERGIRWDDPCFCVEWPLSSEVIVSEKDQSWADYRP